MKIIIFGSDGMLGNCVSKYLSQLSYDIININRKDYDIENDDIAKLEYILSQLSENDFVVNCTGLIPHRNETSIQKYIKINSIFPINLSHACEKFIIKLIHISTDCVYDGKTGNYIETDKHNSKEIYGISKSLGENNKMCIIRTSIIGEEIYNKKSLLEWVKNAEQDINGYTNHYWNGITTLCLAKIIRKIIKGGWWYGVRHIYSPKIISKYQLISLIKKVYKLDINIIPIEHFSYQNRSLSSIYSPFKIPDIEIQLYQLKAFFKIFNCSKGEYTEKRLCKFCDCDMVDAFKLGNNFPLAGGFFKIKNFTNEKIYPLSLNFCDNCSLLQCKQVINPDTLFKSGYFYYSSKIPMLVRHFKEYASHLANKFTANNTVLEIGCNDGVFLRPLKDQGFNVIGVDPSDTVKDLITDGYEIYNDYFNDKIVNEIIEKHSQVDIFLSSNSFAHISNMDDIMKLIKRVLKPNGYVIIEVHNSRKIFDELQFDFIYHEHMSYYLVSSFYKISKHYGMTLKDVEFTNIHGSSIRVYLKNSVDDISEKIEKILSEEKYLCQIDNFKNYYSQIKSWKKEFLTLYYSLRKESKNIFGYGSSGRANILCSFCNIELDEIIDDSKSKIGSYTPIFHQEIKSLEIINTVNPEYIIILAWPYAKDIINNNISYLKNGGKFIIPLPIIQVISITNLYII